MANAATTPAERADILDVELGWLSLFGRPGMDGAVLRQPGIAEAIAIYERLG
jgi:hypothetical protein